MSFKHIAFFCAIAALTAGLLGHGMAQRGGGIRGNTALFNSPHQVTLGNPSGDVTLVEFFDYNCGYCKRSLSDKLELMRADPKLKVVLKEFPVLGPASVEAAHVAIAVRMQDPKGEKYLAFHQKLMGGRGRADKAAAMAAARAAGCDIARLERDLRSDEIRTTLEEVRDIAGTVGITGTPSYVVGEQLLPGAVGLDVLRSQVSAARGAMHRPSTPSTVPSAPAPAPAAPKKSLQDLFRS